jgi:uncharacterized LabA/DUF88 family protein
MAALFIYTRMKKSIIYIDGFNLYYGAVKGTPWKWLDLEKYFTLLRQNDDIQQIKYFTAEISGSHRPNQDNYLLALSTLSKVEIILGKFKTKQVKCLVSNCTYSGSRIFNQQEEKRTDVNIALHMLHDAYEEVCERIILVSGDSDIVSAFAMIKNLKPKIELVVYIPARNPIRGAAVELRNAADKSRTLPNGMLRIAQFPPTIQDSSGNVINKPQSW